MAYLFFFTISTTAQYKEKNPIDYFETYTEVLITVSLGDSGYSFDTYVLISKSNDIYLNVEELFKSLEIKCIVNLNTLVGFIENEQNLYTVNFEKKQIIIGGKSINISNGILTELGVNYIKASLISEAFGLNFIYNPRTLSAKLKSNFELPLYKKLKRIESRKNISKLQKKTVIIDTSITRSYHLLRFGSMDWGINSSQGNNKETNTAISIAVGTELLFGETNFSIGYNPKKKFDIKNINANWRWIDNNKKFIKQAIVGRVSAPVSLSSNLSRVGIGVTINNTPNTVRKATGFYTITDSTEPNWNVELYINDVLVDFTRADAAGLYLFKVPIVFGLTTIKLKFYGPLGEVRTEERTKSNPYTVVPNKALEYSFTAGILEGASEGSFGNLKLNYGFTNSLTITASLDYLFNNTEQTFMPNASVTFRPIHSMLFNVDYLHNQGITGLLNYHITKDAFLNINYTQFTQRFSNLLSDLSISFSKPLKNKFFTGFTRISFNQNRFEAFNYNSINLILSTAVKKININSNLFINWASANTPQINNSLALSYNLPSGLRLRALTAYNFSNSELGATSISLQKKISKINLNFSYQRNIQDNTNQFNIAATYNLPFSRMAISSSYFNNTFSISESARGSMAFDLGNTIIHTANNSALGKGGLLLYPFVDLNDNGELDKEEKMVLVSSVKTSSAKAVISKKDSIVRLFDLNAFIDYNITFSDTVASYNVTPRLACVKPGVLGARQMHLILSKD